MTQFQIRAMVMIEWLDTPVCAMNSEIIMGQTLKVAVVFQGTTNMWNKHAWINMKYTQEAHQYVDPFTTGQSFIDSSFNRVL